MVEPPKDYWFLMGEYLPPPTGLLALAAYLERELEDVEVEILDCQAEAQDWKGVEDRLISYAPDLVAASGFTCNAYACARVAEIAKKVDPRTTTVMGGQHFTVTDRESLVSFPEIDCIARGEGERTLVDLMRTLREGRPLTDVDGLSFRSNGDVLRNRPRPLIEDLDSLPFPAYHLVERNLDRYHFTMMAGRKRYLIMEGSRGCWHKCSFCTQWRHWNGAWRTKSPHRMAEEMAFLRDELGAEFVWLTDDNFELGRRGRELCQEMRAQGLDDSFSWFFQSRTDDIAQHPQVISDLRKAGNNWQLIGVENCSPDVLQAFKKGSCTEDAKQAVGILRENGIFAQAMMVIGSRMDSAESIDQLREFASSLDPHLAIFTVLTPYPGTEVQQEALRNGWIEDTNYSHYDMVHAIMPTEHLTRQEVQEQLYACYRSFFGSPRRAVRGIFSRNETMKRCFRHMAGKRVLSTLRQMI